MQGHKAGHNYKATKWAWLPGAVIVLWALLMWCKWGWATSDLCHAPLISPNPSLSESLSFS